MLWCRCLYCDGGFMSETDTDVCQKCEGRLRKEYANDPTPPLEIDTRWRYSRSVMQERLSVSGDRDE
jgi:hypothetical protein